MAENTSRSLLIRPEDCLLVVVDVQDRLMPVIHEGQAVLDNIERLLGFARVMGIPVLSAEQGNLGPTVPQVRAALPEYDPVDKLHFGCFGCGEFERKVRESGRSVLLLCGVETHVCVCQTALQALERGLAVHVAADGVSSRAPGNVRVGLDRMARAGVVVSSTEMMIFELLEQAGREEFRKVLPLVK